MTKSLRFELLDTLSYLRDSDVQHPYLPDIVHCMEEMLKCFDGDQLINKDQINKLVLSLDRLLSDDYELYKSEVGVKVINAISETLKATKDGY